MKIYNSIAACYHKQGPLAPAPLYLKYSAPLSKIG